MQYEAPNGDTINYRVHLPANMDPEKQYPLLMFFHGSGERGSDNTKQLTHAVGDILSYTQKQQQPAIIIAPQCPLEQRWVNAPWSEYSHTMPPEASQPLQLAIALMNDAVDRLPVDTARIYISGLSMGGFASWDTLQRMPDVFAGAVIVAGGGDTKLAHKLTEVPIWAFHGDQDDIVKPQLSRDMIKAIQAHGGKAKYTEYKDVGHDSWTQTYANDEVLDWLFSQSKAD